MMRSWRASWTASGLSALAYTFSGPILFQYCNIIYLVGAAWLPLGLLAVDRWLRLGRPIALAELAVVLALETLGGDPETAYLTGVCALGYAAALSWRGRTPRPGEGTRPAPGAGSPIVRLVVPLGLCYLPAFVLVGLVPVVVSLGAGLLG